MLAKNDKDLEKATHWMRFVSGKVFGPLKSRTKKDNTSYAFFMISHRKIICGRRVNASRSADPNLKIKALTRTLKPSKQLRAVTASQADVQGTTRLVKNIHRVKF